MMKIESGFDLQSIDSIKVRDPANLIAQKSMMVSEDPRKYYCVYVAPGLRTVVGRPYQEHYVWRPKGYQETFYLSGGQKVTMVAPETSYYLLHNVRTDRSATFRFLFKPGKVNPYELNKAACRSLGIDSCIYKRR